MHPQIRALPTYTWMFLRLSITYYISNPLGKNYAPVRLSPPTQKNVRRRHCHHPIVDDEFPPSQPLQYTNVKDNV